MGADGMIWWSTPAATVGLLVADGRVVDCPPYARGWALGRDARELWRAGRRQGADLTWLPDPGPDGVNEERRDLLRVYYRRTVARWGYRGGLPAFDAYVAVGWHPDGWWWVGDTRERTEWVFSGADQRALRAAAMARAEQQMAAPYDHGGRWEPAVAEYVPGQWKSEAAQVPDWPPGFEPG